MNQISGCIDFLEFISLEERNLLASMTNLRKELDLFYNLDQVYRKPLIRLNPTPNEAVIPQLYYFVHYHLYTTTACFFRAHLAEALSSSRKAIDGALSAYLLIKHPELSEAYLKGDRKFIYIKNTIKKALKEDKTSYPMATGLLGLHETFSQYGSHADFATFIHRFKIKTDTNGSTLFTFDYFHKPEKTEDFKYFYLCSLNAYLQIFFIFREYFNEKFKIIDASWENQISTLEDLLPKYIEELKSQL